MWADGAGWKMSHPWMASFVDFDLGRPGWLLGLVPGRSAAAIRRLLPQATIVVDHWPLVRLAT